MFRISRKEEEFYDLFIEAAEKSLEAAKLLEDLMSNYVDVTKKIDDIEKIEHECDKHVHRILQKLNASFITPIDREDIYLIAKELDTITDSIEATAHRFKMYNVTSVRDDAKAMSKLITQCTSELRDLMSQMKSMKENKVLKQKIIEVNRLEDDGDRIFRTAVSKLFIAQEDATEVLKWKEIYEHLESTLDACEDVANIVEGVVMKHA
ncbi:MAG: DUF47 family protein [Clostridia bacterium]|nr:DUF47 family protein [Clostridia bacterium]